MEIPQSWIDEILSKLDSNILIRPAARRIEKELIEYINLPINKSWDIPIGQKSDFKKFFIDTICSQINPFTHGLTCGINSEHALLVPRIHYDNRGYLVCPTCGYIQFHVKGGILCHEQSVTSQIVN